MERQAIVKRRSRQLAGVFVAVILMTGLIAMWIPRQHLENQNPIKALISPKSYTATEIKRSAPTWRQAMFGDCRENLWEMPDTRPANPKLYDCYKQDAGGLPRVWQYQRDSTFVDRQEKVSRSTALAAIGRDMARVGILQLIVFVSLLIVIASYRIVAGDRTKPSGDKQS
jgi:hypothetical protein